MGLYHCCQCHAKIWLHVLGLTSIIILQMSSWGGSRTPICCCRTASNFLRASSSLRTCLDKVLKDFPISAIWLDEDILTLCGLLSEGIEKDVDLEIGWTSQMTPPHFYKPALNLQLERNGNIELLCFHHSFFYDRISCTVPWHDSARFQAKESSLRPEPGIPFAFGFCLQQHSVALWLVRPGTSNASMCHWFLGGAAFCLEVGLTRTGPPINYGKITLWHTTAFIDLFYMVQLATPFEWLNIIA